jgi:protein TorT
VENASNRGTPVIEVINNIYSPTIRAKALVSFYEMGYRDAEFVIADAADRNRVKVAFFPGPRGSGWALDTLKGFFKMQRDNPGKIKLFPPRWGDTGYDTQRRLIEDFLRDFFMLSNGFVSNFRIHLYHNHYIQFHKSLKRKVNDSRK